tara:strand:- start:227 stop:904 length:678 start_codon:yes stop_codon:yes gene_type:complete
MEFFMKRVTSKLLNFLLIVLFLNFSFSECQGDANQDQNLDVLDIVVVVNHVLNFQLLDDQQFNLADINADSVLDILDIVSIVNMILSGEGLTDCDDGCNDSSEFCIDIHSVFKQFDALELDSNGYYHFSYNPTGQSESDYGTVYYMTTDPVTRVGWSSPDSFYVYHMGQIFWEPVINYSTYSGSDGEGQQLFYVNPTLIGDTLDIYGYYFYHPEIIDSVKVIIGE